MSKSSFYLFFTQLVARTVPSNRKLYINISLAIKYVEFIKIAQELKLITVEAKASVVIITFTKKGVAINNKILRKVGK